MAVFLQKVLVKQGLEDAAVAALADVHDDVELLDAYMETGTGFTYRLASRKQGDTGHRQIIASLWRAPDSFTGLIDPSSVDEVTVRRVELEVPPVLPTEQKMVILRRYLIQGDWDEFLAIWAQAAEMRERHDFHVTFAVSDRETREFTWAFTTELDDFGFFMREGQAEYYADPRRVELETINAFLEQITLTPARRLC